MPPSASRQNFSDEPSGTGSMSPMRCEQRLGPRDRDASGWRRRAAAPAPGRARAARLVVAIAAQRAEPPRVACHSIARHRRLHHAEHRHAVLDQRDVDGELAIALDELAGAVERIDQPQPPPFAAHARRRILGGFLRQDRDVGRQLAPARRRCSGARRGRPRSAATVVVLVFDREFAVVDAAGSRRPRRGRSR